jgi:hypothetical protein
MSKRLIVGDVLELRCNAAFAYVAYAGEHDRLGDAIWVVPRLFATRPTDWEEVFGEKGYFVFFRVYSVVREGLLSKVAHSARGSRPVPETVRQRRYLDPKAPVQLWHLTSDGDSVVKADSDLSPEERAVPIAGIWNYLLLCERISQGWMP